MRCSYIPNLRDGEWICTQCKRPTPSGRTYPTPPIRGCTKRGLGDYVEIVLLFFGLTKSRYARITRRGGGCGACGERQEAMNRAGWRSLAWIKSKLSPRP